MSIFIQPTVSHFRESELAFNNAELVFHLCPDARLVSVPAAVCLGQLPVATAFSLSEVPGAWCMVSNCLFLSGVCGVAPNSGFLTMEQVRQYLGIVDISRRRDYGMDELGTAVDTDMGFHTEVPLIALARLAHLRIALLLLVLGGTRGANDTGINNGAAGNLQPVLLQILIDQVEQLVTQIVLLHQVAELADCGLVRYRLPTEVDADKLSQRAGIVEGFLGRRIRQVEPVLDEVNAQHALDANRAPACALGFGIERIDNGGQFLPRDDGFHLLQELLLAGFLPVLLKSGVRKRILAHQTLLLVVVLPIMNQYWN